MLLDLLEIVIFDIKEEGKGLFHWKLIFFLSKEKKNRKQRKGSCIWEMLFLFVVFLVRGHISVSLLCFGLSIVFHII
jgi:hypothetical protein